MGIMFDDEIWAINICTIQNRRHFHSNGKIAEKRTILLQVQKATEITDGNLTCHVSILEDEVDQ